MQEGKTPNTTTEKKRYNLTEQRIRGSEYEMINNHEQLRQKMRVEENKSKATNV